MRSRGSDSIVIVCPTGSSETTIIVSARTVAEPRGIDPDEQHVDPLVERRRGLDGRLLGVEHLGERSRRRAVAVRHNVRDGHEQEDHRDPTMPRRPVGPARRVSRNACPTARSRHASSRTLMVSSVPRTCGATATAARRVRDWVDTSATATEFEDQRRHQEQHREAGSPVERLTETGEHCREAGRGEAAAVDGSGIGPDSAGVHDGRWSSDSGRSVRAGVYPEGGHGDAGRSISLPVTTRRLVCDAFGSGA